MINRNFLWKFLNILEAHYSFYSLVPANTQITTPHSHLLNFFPQIIDAQTENSLNSTDNDFTEIKIATSQHSCFCFVYNSHMYGHAPSITPPCQPIKYGQVTMLSMSGSITILITSCENFPSIKSISNYLCLIQDLFTFLNISPRF